MGYQALRGFLMYKYISCQSRTPLNKLDVGVRGFQSSHLTQGEGWRKKPAEGSCPSEFCFSVNVAGR